MGLVVLAGGLCLAIPFWGDQALFTLYARELTQGAVLYRDVFDVKQPGIFLFYAAGGLLFGFSEVGIHLFELTYWIGFSIFALVALRPYFTARWGAPLVPVLTVVVYYFYGGTQDFTQIEILVAFPLLVAWWLIDQADPLTTRGVRLCAVAGLAAAVVVLLKHLYLLIILAFLGYAVLRARRRGVAIGEMRRSVAVFLITLVVPLVLVGAYFAVHGQLGRIWWAYFELSPAAQLFTPRPWDYLKLGARRFTIGHAPIVILAAIGCVHALRQPVRPKLDLVIGMMLWTASGAVAFFVLQGWTEYKWLLFTVPLGILAVVGIEALVAFAKSVDKRPSRITFAVGMLLAGLGFMVGAPEPQFQTRLLLSVVIGATAGIGAALVTGRPHTKRLMLWVVAAALAISIGLAAIGPVNKLRALVNHNFAMTVETRTAFQQSWNDSYRAADNDLEVLRSGDVLPGAFYVFGDPVLLLRANRRQAISILGWGCEFLDRRAWQELHAELRMALPPYIIVEAYSESVIRRRYPAIMQLIESQYKVAFLGASGTWYVLK